MPDLRTIGFAFARLMVWMGVAQILIHAYDVPYWPAAGGALFISMASQLLTRWQVSMEARA